MPNPAFLTSNLSLLLAFGTIGFLLVVWAIRLPRFAVALLPLSLVAGQMMRVPLPGQGGGWLVSDIVVVIVLLSAMKIGFSPRGARPPLHPRPTASPLWGCRRSAGVPRGVTQLFLPFILWSIWTLVIHFSSLGTANFTIAFAYWVRLAAYLLLLPALMYLCADKKTFQTLKKSFLVSIGILISVGFLQIMLLPHLAILGNGWDPHEERLVSTWLDPNFFGVFLGISSFWLAALVTNRHSGENRNPVRRIIWILLILDIIALLLTQSRSSLIAWFLTVIILLPFVFVKIRRSYLTPVIIFGVASVIFISVLLGTILLGDRALGLLQGDATVSARTASLVKVIDLASSHSIVGVGYNAYQFAAQEAGLISDFSIHSRGGADNSILTLWVTTGLTGVLLFFIPWFIFGSIFMRGWLVEGRAESLAAVGSLLLLFIHSQFVNSFLYPHLLLTIVIITIITKRHPGLDPGSRGDDLLL